MRERQVFERFFPESAVEYCLWLWKNHQFNLKIKNKRSSKLGDYRYNPSTSTHTISINNDLNPYAFLITYLHEVAHLITFDKYGSKVPPHGEEWKTAFKDIMRPVVTNKVFPETLNNKVVNYMKNPKATSCNDHHLTMALRQYDRVPGQSLHQLDLGSLFRLGKRTFKKENLRRTRYVCQEVKTGRRYLISKSALVEPL